MRELQPKITRNHDYWLPEDLESLGKAQSFSELSKVAMGILKRMPQPVGQVCGPISTGGTGKIEENLKIFDGTISRLIAEGQTIFDQMPFEEHFFRIINEEWGTRHNNQLLDDFYLPILASGLVKTLYFIPGWESSHGAAWEHDQAQRLGIEIVYLSKALIL